MVRRGRKGRFLLFAPFIFGPLFLSKGQSEAVKKLIILLAREREAEAKATRKQQPAEQDKLLYSS